MIKAILPILLIVGCGGNLTDYVKRTTYVNKRTPHIEEEFRPFVNKFDNIYGTDVRILVAWSTLGETTLGECHSWSDGYREIKIDDVKWPYLTEDGKEHLIFHELGHCIFNLDHNSNYITINSWHNIPESIMNPYAFGDRKYYSDNKDYYFNQLGEASGR